jgi:hypothetical protein
MNAKQRLRWVAALKAVQAAAALPNMSRNELREWARVTLTGIASSALSESDLDHISRAFSESSGSSPSGMPRGVLFRYKTDWPEFPLDVAEQSDALSDVLLQLGQAKSPYPQLDAPVTPLAAYLLNPFSSPSSYLAHPGIDVLDQETITRIASRDTGA